MRNCSSCAHANRDDVERCVECGTLLDAPATDGLKAELLSYIARGEKIRAIALYREKTGVGLRGAKDAVDALAASGDHSVPEPAPMASKIVTLLQEGRKIEAIKLHREQTGAGLKEAKDAVERLGAKEGIELPRGGCAAVLALVVALALILPGGRLSLAQDKEAPPFGTWEGSLKIGTADLKLKLRVTRGAGGGLAGKLDVPAQGALGLALDECAYEEKKLRFAYKAAGFRFEGERAANGESFTGTFHQAGLALPLTLKRTAKTSTGPRRPQTPKPPYPYAVRDAVVPSAPGVRLSGTLTVPKGAGPYPAVVLVSGSGPQDRDESLFGHKPFLVLADHLTRKGVAVLRYDDRGTAKSTGTFASATSEDFAADAAAAVAWLRTQEGIDAGRIGVAGHSEGGLIAAMVAAKDAKVAFIVLLAGPGVPGEEVLYRQSELIARAGGATDAAVKQNRELQKRIFEAVRTEPDAAKARAKVREVLEGLLPPAQIEQQVAMTSGPWFRFFLSYDPCTALVKVKCPVLAVNGEKDLQVDPEQNLGPIGKALRGAGNETVKVVQFKGLNHLFQTCKSGLVTEYGEIEETFAPAALETISAWIVDRVR